MSFQDLLRDTLATLWAHKRRTMLTMFGIAWGIISITVMVAAGEGLGKGIQNNQETFGKDVMIVFAGRTSMQAGGARSGRLIRWREEDYVQVAKEAPACKYVMPELGNNVQVHSLFNSGDLQVVGALPPFTEIRSISVAQGRFYNEQDNAEARNVTFLGSDAKKQLFAEREALGQTISLNGTPYTVIGVMKPKEQNSSYDGADVRKIFIPFNAMRRDFPNKPPAVEHSVDRLLVAPWSLETHPDCVKQARRSLGRLHNFDPRDKEAASIWDTVKNAEANRMIIVGMEVFMGAVGVATLFLGGLGVMNVMLVSVRERTREIGVRKALGATRESILRQFFLETVIVVALSGGTGLLLSYGFCALVNLLTMTGIAWGIVAVTLLLSYGSGFRGVLMYTFEVFGKGAVVCWPGTTSEQAGGERAGKAVRFEQEDADWVKAQSPLVKRVTRETVRWKGITHEERLSDTAIRGVYPEYGEMRNEIPMEGRWISPEDIEERRRVAFLGAILRRKLFSGTPAIGETVRIDGVKFTVVGSMDTKFSDSNYFTSDDESVFIPYTTAGDLWDARYASVMLFEPVAPNFEADAMRQFRAAIANRQHFSPNDKRAITMFGREEFKPIYEGITLGIEALAVGDGGAELPHGVGFKIWRDGLEQ